MSNQDKKIVGRTALGVGLATLVTVLVAVLLTTFSVLALVSSRADLHLSTKTAEAMESYYAADSLAETWLYGVEQHLSTSEIALSTELNRAGYNVGATNDGQIMLSQTFKVDAIRSLVVEIKIVNGSEIEILKWQVTAKPQQ